MTGEPIRNKVSGRGIARADRASRRFRICGRRHRQRVEPNDRRPDADRDRQTTTASSPTCTCPATVSSAPDLTSRLLRHERLIVVAGIALLSRWLVLLLADGAASARAWAMMPPPLGALVADVVADDGGDDAAVAPRRRSCSMRGSAAAARRQRSLRPGSSSPAICSSGCSSRSSPRSRSCSHRLAMTLRAMAGERGADRRRALSAVAAQDRRASRQCRSPAQFLSRHWRPGVAARCGSASCTALIASAAAGC